MGVIRGAGNSIRIEIQKKIRRSGSMDGLNPCARRSMPASQFFYGAKPILFP
jgi:hypothetical protein